jgi:hypothetical protein
VHSDAYSGLNEVFDCFVRGQERQMSKNSRRSQANEAVIVLGPC